MGKIFLNLMAGAMVILLFGSVFAQYSTSTPTTSVKQTTTQGYSANGSVNVRIGSNSTNSTGGIFTQIGASISGFFSGIGNAFGNLWVSIQAALHL